MLDRVKQLLANESGATAIEYALIASLVALALIATDTILAGKLNNTFNEVAGNLN
jgi:pilus assembly protein Flp/PilA